MLLGISPELIFLGRGVVLFFCGGHKMVVCVALKPPKKGTLKIDTRL